MAAYAIFGWDEEEYCGELSLHHNREFIQVLSDIGSHQYIFISSHNGENWRSNGYAYNCSDLVQNLRYREETVDEPRAVVSQLIGWLEDADSEYVYFKNTSVIAEECLDPMWIIYDPGRELIVSKRYCREAIGVLRQNGWDRNQLLESNVDSSNDERTVNNPCPACDASSVDFVIADMFGIHYECLDCEHQFHTEWVRSDG